MSAALVIDIHSPAFWDWVDRAYPGTVAATIDGNGMTALHTAGPLYFEKAGKWITHPQGLRTNLSLTQVGDRRDGLIAWHPNEAKARLGRAQASEFGQANAERRSPVTISKVPDAPAPAPAIEPTTAPVASLSTPEITGGALVGPVTYEIADAARLTSPVSSELMGIRDALYELLVRVETLLKE